MAGAGKILKGYENKNRTMQRITIIFRCRISRNLPVGVDIYVLATLSLLGVACYRYDLCPNFFF